MLVPVVSSVAVITLRLSVHWLRLTSQGLLWDPGAVPHPAQTQCLPGCCGAQGVWAARGIWMGSSSGSLRFPPLPMKFSLLFPPGWLLCRAGGLMGLRASTSLKRTGWSGVGRAAQGTCRCPGISQDMVRQLLALNCVAGMGALLHGWRLPSAMLCAPKLRV